MTSSPPGLAYRTLFGDLIDYAGVFPPARLPVTEARRRYTEAVGGEEGWILGPCLLRAGQLPDLLPGQAPDRLGVVLDLPIREVSDRMQIQQVELLTSAGSVDGEVRAAAEMAPVVYAESRSTDGPAFLEEIAILRNQGIDVRAKLRTGGLSPQSPPSVGRVARFVETAVRLRVPFKATAGLHHPFRGPRDLPGAVEHGFINLLAAVRAALAGDSVAIRSALAETDPHHFDPAAATWRKVGRTVTPESIRAAFRSFGSCSLTEPFSYLRELGSERPGAGP